MSDLLKYKQVNWIDGMKINKDHFISLENHFVARSIDWNNQLLNHNIYGLLPHRANKEKFLSVKTIIDNQNYLNVKVESCHAITQGGYRIEISGEELTNDFRYALMTRDRIVTKGDVKALCHKVLIIILNGWK